ncbi:MAG: hypothetical protein ACHQ4H_08605 [Ktedonobacterales bacterium]
MWHLTLRRTVPLIGLMLLIVLLAAACDRSPTGGVPLASPTATGALASPTLPPSTPTRASGPYPVKVYFSRHPDSDNSPTAVFAVPRVSPTLGVATYAITQLIAGPSGTEQSSGYYTPLIGALSGSSNCGGADFTITLDHRGPKSQTGTATLQFCRGVALAGDLTGPRISSEIGATLKQFSNIQQVVILTSGGNCFDDARGANACLN